MSLNFLCSNLTLPRTLIQSLLQQTSALMTHLERHHPPLTCRVGTRLGTCHVVLRNIQQKNVVLKRPVSVLMIALILNEQTCFAFLCQVSKEKSRFEKLMEYFINDDCNIDFMVG